METVVRLSDFLESACEIKSEDNDLLAVVRVISAEDERLMLAPVDGEAEALPLLAYNTRVKILFHSGTSGFVLLMGHVYISSPELLVLVDIQSEQGMERRRFFRQNVEVPGTAYRIIDRVETLQEEQMGQQIPARTPDTGAPFAVTIHDVSLGGLRIDCATALKPNDQLCVSFTLFGVVMEFDCTVRRVIERRSGGMQYGCAFLECSTRQTDRLCRQLFQLQRMELQKRRRIKK